MREKQQRECEGTRCREGLLSWRRGRGELDEGEEGSLAVYSRGMEGGKYHIKRGALVERRRGRGKKWREEGGGGACGNLVKVL